MNKPKCAVNGMVRPGAMCGSVIVGGKLCGHAGECQHKIAVCEYCEGTGVDPESFRSPLELKCPACKPSNVMSRAKPAL